MPSDFITPILKRIYETYKPLKEGHLPTYIPQLTTGDPDLFAISIITFDGDVYEIGDVDHAFTIQSISKPFLHGLVLETHGRASVMAKIGVEPTGDPFNAIKLQPDTNLPFNPMVNAGAIALTDMIPGATADLKIKHIKNILDHFSDSSLKIDPDVYHSEKQHGNHNRAMAYLMLNFGVISENVEEILDVYFKACSFLVTPRQVAHMAASLANGGAHLQTHQPILAEEHVRDILSVMFTCGMYDFAGEWAYTVGFPAKSGVSGGIMGVVPHKLGICVFSPRLDSRGNSVRGIKVFQELSQVLKLSIF